MAKAGDRIYRLDEDLDGKWTDYLQRTGLSQQAAIQRLIEWHLSLPSIGQAMIIGSVVADEQLVEILAKRLKEPPRAASGGMPMKISSGMPMKRAAKGFPGR